MKINSPSLLHEWNNVCRKVDGVNGTRPSPSDGQRKVWTRGSSPQPFFGESNCHCSPERSRQTGQSLFAIPTLSFRRAVFGMQRLRSELLWSILNSCCCWEPRHGSYLSLHFSISENSLSSSSHRSLPCFSKALRKYFPCRSVFIRQKSHL